jgi:predicted Zn-dependent peptidase
VHIQIGGRAPGRESPERFSVRAFDVILGGSVSSRLFSDLRESRGLAYDTGSFISGCKGVSEWGAYIATRPERASEAAAALGQQIKTIRTNGVSEDEVSRAVSHLRGRYLLSRESMAERAGSIVSQLHSGLEPATAAEVLAQLEKVTVDSVNEVVNQLTDPEHLQSGSIGPDDEFSATALEAATSGTLNP